jgi:RHS repeat-associated protein
MVYSNFSRQTLETDQTYNYLGNPLSKTTIETSYAYPSGTQGTPIVRNSWYAYWDDTKFCQQKAVLANDGTVLSYTDYNPVGSTTGVGMTKLVYEAKYGNLGKVTITPASGNTPATPATSWYNSVAPGTGAVPSAMFWYDGQGRSTKVDKLVSSAAAGTIPTGYSVPNWQLNDSGYDVTTTSYYGNSSPGWGLANTVIEDYGSGNNYAGQPYVNRTTTTGSYDSAGHALTVQGPLGTYVTAYDADGLVQTVTCNGTSVVQYTYGTPAGISGGQPAIDNGQPISITDGLTGVAQTISYDNNSADGGYGQVQTVSQAATSAGTGAYTVQYGYTSHGERQFATYTTPNDTEIWQYADFIQVGQGTDAKMAFQTLLKVTGSVSNPVPTSEEEDYAYDTSGRIENAAFAQTPQTNYTPPSGNRWYSTSEEPASRCREFFDFDPAGRNLNLQYMWETFAASGTSPASVTNITGWNYTYEADLTNQNLNQDRGLKTNASLYNGTGTSWVLDHTENYTYEAQRGFLIGAQYNDGQPNASPTWTYNESQTRTDTVTNDLNQAGYFVGGNGAWTPYTDQAGRTLTRGAATLGWDCVSRLTSYTTTSGTSNCEYRADGMRDHRHLPGSTTTDWSYYHDGQTTFEDYEVQGTALTLTRYGLGARGIDECERQTGTVSGGLGATVSTWYPVYDGHGNQCGTLARAANNTYTLSNVRTFDAWGNVRRGNGTGDPASRYCGSLGHVQDDESLLLYMRARYYDPAAGRFISEDPSRSASNLYEYANNTPANRVDISGKDSNDLGWACWSIGIACLSIAVISALLGPLAYAAAVGAAEFAIIFLAAALASCQSLYGGEGAAIRAIASEVVYRGMVQTIIAAEEPGGETDAAGAIAACSAYALAVVAALIANDAASATD